MAQPNAYYRNQNTRLRASLAKAVGNQFTMLNLSDLDGSWPAYYSGVEPAIVASAQAANLLAINNFRIWLYDEVGEVMAERFLNSSVALDLNDAAAMLNLKGPIEIKRLIKAGWSPEQAWLSAMRQTVNVSQGYVHAIGQRSLVGMMGEHPHVLQGWRRIISPMACSFCRALERIVYHPSDKWVKPHDKCGCTAEPVPNTARVVRYLTPVEKARNNQIAADIARRLDREKAELQQVAAMADRPSVFRDILEQQRRNAEAQRAKSPGTMPALFGKAASRADIAKWDKALTERNVTTRRLDGSSSFSVMDRNVAQSIADEAVKQLDYYPTLHKAVHNIEGYTAREWADEWNPRHLAFIDQDSHVHINNAKMRPSYFDEVDRSGWAVSRNPGDVLNHEIGHGILHNFGTNKTHWRTMNSILKRHGLVNTIGDDIALIDKDRVATLMGSRYATESAHEFFAECWALYQRDEGAAPDFVLEIAGYMEKLLGSKARRNVITPNLGTENRFHAAPMRDEHPLPDEIVWHYSDFVSESLSGRSV